jgi:hypothetical protein
MPSNPTPSPEQRRMVTFDAIAPDGTRERLRFETQEYRQLKILGRSRMTASTKSRALRKFGRRLYEALPW